MSTEKMSSPRLPRENESPARRGPKPAHTPAQIARAAIRIAGKEGLESVTMQRVAKDMGLTTMALYRYFPDKAELIAAMIEAAGRPAPETAKPPLPWIERLRKWAR